MANVYDVADFFIASANSVVDEQVSNLKVNKLLYYAQGCYLARTGKLLFQNSIEAWTYGPVVPEVYQKYRPCGRNPITVVSAGYTEENFTDEELDALFDVQREFGKYTGSALVTMSHRRGTPWSMTKESDVIDEQLIRDYFTKNPVPTFAETLADSGIEIVDTLPEDWYDPDEDDEWKEYVDEV